MARRKKKGNNILSILIAVLFLLLIAGLLLSRYPALVFVPIVLAIVLAFRKILLQRKENRLYMDEMCRKQTIGNLIAELHANPQSFEKYVADLFEFYGFDTHVTPGSNDGGKDIVMYKDGYTYVVEVKLYATYNKIDREKIQKLHSAMGDCRADYAIFVTTSEFTSPAIEFAERNGIDLIDGNRLVDMIDERSQAYQNAQEGC